MKKSVFSALLIIGLLINLSNPITILAEEYYSSPLDITSDNYVNFGDDTHSPDENYDITLTVDVESTATWWINLGFEISPQIQEDRDIVKYYILANGKIVDTVNLQFQDADGNGVLDPVGYYNVKPETLGFAGGYVVFQVIAVQDSNTNYYISGELIPTEKVVAWSAPSELVHMDPVKVNDSEAISVLQSILAKLQELLNTLAGKLDSIASILSTMFTPSPEAQQRLDNAMNNLFNSTPMKDMLDQQNSMKNMFDNTQLDTPMEKITFGEKRDWFGVGVETYLIDLTELKDQIELMRNVLAAVIWIEFFVWLIFYLSPKLGL